MTSRTQLPAGMATHATAAPPGGAHAALVELAQWEAAIGLVEKQLKDARANRAITPENLVAFEVQCEDYLANAKKRMAMLRKASVAPSVVLTPNQARKASRKLAKSEKKKAKQERRLRGLATTAMQALPEGSPLRAAAATAMSEGTPAEKRRAALETLIDSVPTTAPHFGMVKVLAKEMLDDDDDDDDNDDE